jgi:formiminotetrahydrofolate cyclodeaminase
VSDAAPPLAPDAAAGSLPDQSIGSLLEALSARSPAPGGGSAAALALALAAGLCGMAARYSEAKLDSAPAIAAAADRVRHRAVELAEEDARAYGAVLAARRLPPETEASVRDEAIATAMAYAVAVPSEVAELGAELAKLADDVASRGNANLLGDALSALLLAEAAAAAARTIVEINVVEAEREPGAPSGAAVPAP